jgi:hypothetical protein
MQWKGSGRGELEVMAKMDALSGVKWSDGSYEGLSRDVVLLRHALVAGKIAGPRVKQPVVP